MSPTNKKRSELWNFFSVVDDIYALCDLCRIKISYKTSVENKKNTSSGNILPYEFTMCLCCTTIF